MPFSLSLQSRARTHAGRLSRFAAVCAVFSVLGCGDSPTSSNGTPSNPATDTYAAALNVSIPAMTKKSDNLYIQDLAVGTGAEAIAGRRLTMAYTGWLANGTQFDSSIGRSDFPFTLGSGQVIGGWDQGVAGMRVGGRRRLVIGSALGYGSTGSGAIPPNATLVFTVELKSVQ